MSNKHRKGRGWRRLGRILAVVILLKLIFFIWFIVDTKINPPEIEDLSALELQRENTAPDFFVIGDNSLRKNEFGLWEMAVEGSPFEMGVVEGKLSKELIHQQEEAFVEQINVLVPSPSYLKFLKYFIAFFNRDIDENILPEFQEEIYGVSFSASNEYDYIGNNYERMLNYHAAHDIGHALQALALVGCTSFSANMNSTDSSLVIGRNFDFYINPAFAENKVVAFVRPDSGYQFMYVTWASFIGVVSGMNEKGLTVTINAAKSDIPMKAATPISLLAREILQYAANIDEAFAIAEKRKTFVSESILVGSAADKKAVIIEKSPSKLGMYSTESSELVCSNHFQSEVFSEDENNLEFMKESASVYREERCEELLESCDTIGFSEAASVLRNHLGMENKNIGIGNEKTMAQMISHHSVIFMPEKMLAWVSSNPYQLGAYVAYDLKEIFELHSENKLFPPLYDSSLTIPPDTFLFSKQYADFKHFKEMNAVLEKQISDKKPLPEEEIFFSEFVSSNPEYYLVYKLAGDYYFTFGNHEKAQFYYEKALMKEFENTVTKDGVEEKLLEINSFNK
ncbi:MAG TPA: C45 family peptidase [Bacteroidales bacterium]